MQMPCCNIAVAKQKGNIQTHMIKYMSILLTVNIWKNNVVQFINNIHRSFIDTLLLQYPCGK